MIQKLPTDITHWNSPLEPIMWAKINEIIEELNNGCPCVNCQSQLNLTEEKI